MAIFKHEILPQRLELLNNLLGSQYFFVADRVTISIDLGVMQYRMLEVLKETVVDTLVCIQYSTVYVVARVLIVSSCTLL